jgi:hypothetical protein
MVNGQKVEIMSVCGRYCRVLHEISIKNLKIGTLITKTINKNKKKKKRKKNEQADIIDIIWTQFLLLLFEFFFFFERFNGLVLLGF